MSSPTAGLPDGVAATAGAVRSGDVSAVEVVAAHLEAAGSSQDVLNAFTLIDERAVDRAAAIDSEVAAGSDPGSLAGVPLALKDLIDQAGLPNTLGTNWPPEVRHGTRRSSTVSRRPAL